MESLIARNLLRSRAGFWEIVTAIAVATDEPTARRKGDAVTTVGTKTARRKADAVTIVELRVRPKAEVPVDRQARNDSLNMP